MPGTLNTPAITGPVKSNAFYSFVVTIPDDDVFSWTPPSQYGQIFISSTSVNGHGLAWFRNNLTSKYAGAGNFTCVSTALTGTTGTDGHMTLGVSLGVLYLENRLGNSQEFTVTVVCANAAHE